MFCFFIFLRKIKPKNMSKFITKSRLNKISQINSMWSNLKDDEYISFGSSISAEEKKKQREENNFLQSEKQRIESIPLEELSFRDLYQFPFHQAKYGSWVYDANSNFIFQFEFDNKDTREKAVAILNGEFESNKDNKFVHEDGMIYLEKDGERKEFILIRGWGSLTGTGSYNLDGEYAGKIQDTLAEYIVEKLNK